MINLHHLPGSDLREKTILTYRQHPITLVPILFTAIVLVALPPAGYQLLTTFRPDLLETPAHRALFVLVASAFFLSGWLFLFQSFINFWLDVFILTEKRILDIEQKGLFNRTVSELRLYRTQDVTAEVKGILRTLFDYGDVFVQTAGEQERFRFENIAHPNRVAKQILELAEEDRKEHLEETVEEFGMADHPAERAAARTLEP